MDAYELDRPQRRNGTPARTAHGSTYAELSARIDAEPAGRYGWSRELAEELGLVPETPIGVLLAHADARNRAAGVAGYLTEALARREGRPPAEAVVRIDFAAQYQQLGQAIREALIRRGVPDAIVRTVGEAIAEACERVPDDAI